MNLFPRSRQQKQLKEAVKVISAGSLLFASYLTAVGDERFYANQLMPLLQRVVGAETAHVLAVKMIGMGVVPLNRYQDPASLVSIRDAVYLFIFSSPRIRYDLLIFSIVPSESRSDLK